MEVVLEQIKSAVVNIEIGKVSRLVQEALKQGIPAYRIFVEGIANAMDLVGLRYENGEYFLTELLGASEVVNEAMKELRPCLELEPVDRRGNVVIGVVKGDIHDIGKNIVKMLLTSGGFEVQDLGTDVPAEKFVEGVLNGNPDILAISSLLTTTMGETKNVIDELGKAGLRKRLRIIIGGAPMTEEYAREIGADACAKDAAHGVRICQEWMKRND